MSIVSMQDNQVSSRTEFDCNIHPDATVISACNSAIGLLQTVREWNSGTLIPMPSDDEMAVTQAAAWEQSRQAMTGEVSSLSGVRAQVTLLLMHHELQGNGPEHPEIELPALHNLLRLIAA